MLTLHLFESQSSCPQWRCNISCNGLAVVMLTFILDELLPLAGISGRTDCRYRKWSIAEDIDLVVRCELDGVMKYKGQEQLLLIKALNEFDSKSSGVIKCLLPQRRLNSWILLSDQVLL